MLIEFFNFFLFLSCGWADEPFLSDVRQLTFPEMGFKKSGEAYFSPDGESILFQAVPHGKEDYQIYALHLQSGAVSPISQKFSSCTCSFFRPDGKKIIFAASPCLSEKAPPGTYKWDFTPFMNIYEANPDGTELRQLTFGPAYHAECAYSPDGSEIVYASNEEGSMQIYIMDKDGLNVRRVTDIPDCYNGGPFFSPDGSKILFRSDRGRPHYLQVYTIERDGSHLTELTDNEAVNWAPFWHPSGKAIAFTSSLLGHTSYQIFWLDMKTNALVQITDRSGFNGLPAFNREGTKLLWTSKRSPDMSSQVFIAEFKFPTTE